VTVDTVVFDLGNVLVHWDPMLPFAGRLTDDEVRRFFADVDFGALNLRQDAGRPWAEACAEVARTHPQHVAALTAVCRAVRGVAARSGRGHRGGGR